MKVLRFSLVAAAAVFAAACGDKVNVVGPETPTTPTPDVTSVTVAPATATMSVGETVNMTASVTAINGAAATVTWSSSDATKASVSATGTVTAIAATPGVAICATSTVKADRKGCASVVVQAATTVLPATISISSITTGGNLNTPVTPANVNGNIDITLNVSPGNRTISKVVLLVGGARVDSQTYTAAQSAALRYAADEALSAQTTFPQILFNVNTAAYNATTGVPTFANGAKAISAQLYTTQGGATAAATANAAQNLTFNNTDAIYGTWTLPSTAVNATDAAGYQWTSLGGGTLSLKVTPVLFSGKTATSATVKYTNFNATAKVSCASRITAGTTGACFSATAFGDTASVKTLTTLPGSTTFQLWDRDMINNAGNLANPPVPTVSLVFSDGTSLADANLTAPAGSTLALRIDNAAPGDVTISAPLRGTAKFYRAATSWNARPAARLTDADSSSIVTAIGADLGVSAGATFLTDYRGITWKTYVSAGSTTSTDSSDVTSTAITSASGLTSGSYYCARVAVSDKLGNTSLYPDRTVKTAGATEITTTCPTFGNQTRGNYIDNTAPVNAFAGLANGDWSSGDTATAAAIGAGTMNYFYTRTEAANLTDSILVCVYKNVSGTVTANEYIGGGATTACSKRVAGTGTGTNIPITTATAQANQLTNTVIDAYTGSAGGQVVISVQSYDKAGNIGNKITRIVAYDATAPTASTATVASITQGSAPSVSSFLNDNLSVAQYNLEWTVASTAGQASNTTANLGTLTNAEIATASNAVFRQGATSTGDLITTSPYTKFLNVAATATAPAINYLVKWGAAAPGSNADNILALAGAATTFRVAAFDQTGARSTLEGFAAPTITDAMTLAGTGGSSLAGASGSLTNVALDGAFSYQTNYAASSSALTGSAVLSSSVRLKVSYNYAHDKTSAYFNNKDNTSSTGWVYCTGRTTATGGSPIMSGASAVSESKLPQVVAAPTVDLYLPVRGGAGAGGQPTFEYYGSATALSSTTVTGTPKNGCGDVVTTTYAITVTPGDRTAPNQPWTGGSAVWVVKHGAGYATFLPMGIAYNR